MNHSTLARVSAAVLVSLLTLACSGGSDPTDQQPAVDVSNLWNGDWTALGQPQNPATGQLTLSLVQDAVGDVTGSAAISNIGCATNMTFQGALVDTVLIGTATEAPDVEVRFEIDARQAELGAAGTMLGTFIVVSGTGCPPPFEAEYLVTGTPPAPPAG